MMAQETLAFEQHERCIRRCFWAATLASITSLAPLAYVTLGGKANFAVLDRWAVLVLLAAVLAFALVMLMLLIPHRVNARWVALWQSTQAAAYAIAMAVFTFSGADNRLVSGLDVSDEFLHGNGLVWSGSMTLICIAGSFVSHHSANGLK